MADREILEFLDDKRVTRSHIAAHLIICLALMGLLALPALY